MSFLQESWVVLHFQFPLSRSQSIWLCLSLHLLLRITWNLFIIIIHCWWCLFPRTRNKTGILQTDATVELLLKLQPTVHFVRIPTNWQDDDIYLTLQRSSLKSRSDSWKALVTLSTGYKYEFHLPVKKSWSILLTVSHTDYQCKGKAKNTSLPHLIYTSAQFCSRSRKCVMDRQMDRETDNGSYF